MVNTPAKKAGHNDPAELNQGGLTSGRREDQRSSRLQASHLKVAAGEWPSHSLYCIDCENNSWRSGVDCPWLGDRLREVTPPSMMRSTNVQGILAQHMQQAQHFPILRLDEERELAERWQATQDPAIAEQLLGGYLRLVIKIARGFRGYGLPLDELIAEGNAGMMQALTRYEPARGFRFATYASWWINAAIRE